jgi:hypothetical protein
MLIVCGFDVIILHSSKHITWTYYVRHYHAEICLFRFMYDYGHVDFGHMEGIHYYHYVSV